MRDLDESITALSSVRCACPRTLAFEEPMKARSRPASAASTPRGIRAAPSEDTIQVWSSNLLAISCKSLHAESGADHCLGYVQVVVRSTTSQGR